MNGSPGREFCLLIENLEKNISLSRSYSLRSVHKIRLTIRVLCRKLEQLSKVWPPEQTVEELISDPIGAYSMVRRLTREWPLILNLMMEYVGKIWQPSIWWHFIILR